MAKRNRRRKTLRMLLDVNVPMEMTAAQARQQVRSLINDQCEYYDMLWPRGSWQGVEVNMRVKKLAGVK